MMSDRIKGNASYEPGSNIPFPKGEVPSPIKTSSFFGDFKADEVPLEDFKKLTRYPIVIFYGDYIPKEPSTNPHQDYWRAAVKMARLLADAVNRHGEGGGHITRPLSRALSK